MKFNEILKEEYLTDHQAIENWLNGVGILKDYTINTDGSVNVNKKVDLRSLRLDDLPVKFNVINGFFDCDDNRLTSFKGFPKECDGYVSFNGNAISSLVGISDVVMKINKSIMAAVIYFSSAKIRSGGVELLLIEGLGSIAHGSKFSIEPFQIIEKYLGKPDDIYECQAELVEAGFEEYAQI